MPPIVDDPGDPQDDAGECTAPGIVQLVEGASSLVIFPNDPKAGCRAGIWVRSVDLVRL
jgi:hypothetical protein